MLAPDGVTSLVKERLGPSHHCSTRGWLILEGLCTIMLNGKGMFQGFPHKSAWGRIMWKDSV